ncbi:MAG: (2Fe-2S)-binding protein [Burkholderiales bacterium]|nr:(2Fe-2S)-binding protein [Burkholderiales bacterium]
MHEEQEPAALACVHIDGVALRVDTQLTVVAALALAGRLQTRLSLAGEARFAVCGMGVCHECRVSIDGQPQRLACQTYCRDGMQISTTGAP